MSVVLAFDAIADNYQHLPAGYQVAGYDTGGPGYAWTPAMWKAHPGAVHIDQDPGAGDFTSDILDVEAGAVPVGSPEIAKWAFSATASFVSGKRPGQRNPALYCSASNVRANVNALVHGGINTGIGLWVASWGIGEGPAITDITAAAGPFPVIGVQFASNDEYDTDVFSSAWLADVSGKTPPKPSPLPPSWVYYPCRSLTAHGGTTSVAAHWVSPDGPAGAPGIGGYQVQVQYADGPKKGQDLYHPMRYTPKSPSADEAHQYGSLPENTNLVFMVRAVTGSAGAAGHGGDWATATFKTSS